MILHILNCGSSISGSSALRGFATSYQPLIMAKTMFKTILFALLLRVVPFGAGQPDSLLGLSLTPSLALVANISHSNPHSASIILQAPVDERLQNWCIDGLAKTPDQAFVPYKSVTSYQIPIQSLTISQKHDRVRGKHFEVHTEATATYRWTRP